MRNRGCTKGGGRLVAFVALIALGFSGCGYHVAGKTSTLPSEWSTIAIPAFKNDTTRYRIEQRFTQAVIREFISRIKYQILQDTAGADGLLIGEIFSIDTNPVLFNSTTGEVTTMIVTVHVKVRLTDNHTSKEVYQNSDMVFRDEYQISSDVPSFFE